MSNLLKDSTGAKDSSKRISGIVLMTLGGILLYILGIVSIFKRTADPDTIIKVGNTFMYVGGGLLGIGVVEYLRGIPGGDK